MKKFITAILFAVLALAVRAQNNPAETDPNAADTTRTTNVWFTTNVTPHMAITEVTKPRGLRKIAIIVQNRGSAGLNDKVSSVKVVLGQRWLLCKDKKYRGGCIIVDRDVTDLAPYGFNDRISSLKPID